MSLKQWVENGWLRRCEMWSLADARLPSKILGRIATTQDAEELIAIIELLRRTMMDWLESSHPDPLQTH